MSFPDYNPDLLLSPIVSFGMVVALDSPQPGFSFPPLDTIPDTVEDQPESGTALASILMGLTDGQWI